ncbi:penicillin-binding protein [Chryseobacterium piscicola]|uniref:Penicillin-binding protein n=1 Tax=Chryseobacterium piscicola TaxID=551459 RepID=A0A2S7KBI7_9FLAO|nr:penicillin-binding protein [Chryseobacterium piscicola]
MTKQRVHIGLNLCDSPLIKGLFGYKWMLRMRQKCANLEDFTVNS